MPPQNKKELQMDFTDHGETTSNSNKKIIHKITSLNHRNSIRIGLVGAVSSGKSTLLNAICVNQYEDMKIKRTTMLPSVYKESNQMI